MYHELTWQQITKLRNGKRTWEMYETLNAKLRIIVKSNWNFEKCFTLATDSCSKWRREPHTTTSLFWIESIQSMMNIIRPSFQFTFAAARAPFSTFVKSLNLVAPSASANKIHSPRALNTPCSRRKHMLLLLRSNQSPTLPHHSNSTAFASISI